MQNKAVTNDTWRVDIPDRGSLKSLESNKFRIYDYGCLITPLNAQINYEDDLKSDTLSQVCCNTFLRTRALTVEWQRIRQHILDFARGQFGSVFEEIKQINFKEDYSVLPIIISIGFNIDDFDIAYDILSSNLDIITIKLDKSQQVDNIIKDLVWQVSKRVKLKRGKSLIKRLESAKDLLNGKTILTVISENNPQFLFSLQLIREWTEIPISCLILNVSNKDLFESQIPPNLYYNLRIYQIQAWTSTKIVDDLCKNLLFEPGFTTFLHHPSKILHLWDSYYESFSLSSIMLRLHEILHKAMSDRPLGFSARSLVDLLGNDVVQNEVIPSILDDYPFDKICESDWGKKALSKLAVMALAGGINEPLIAYYQVSLNNTFNDYPSVCNYELPGDNLDENTVHLAIGPLSKGALQLAILKLKFTLGLKISFELMKLSESDEKSRLCKLIELLYANEKFPNAKTCENLFTYLMSINLPINCTIEMLGKPFEIDWFKKLFVELPFYHPLAKQIATCTNLEIIDDASEESDWKILAEIISSYKKCNAWTLFKTFKEQLPKSANIGIAAIRFTSALTSICQIMGICTTRQKNYLINTQNALAKNLSQLMVYRLPNI